MSLSCIACDSREVIRVGPLPVYTPDFLGRPLDSNVDPGCLYRCLNCTLRFRAPQPTAADLMSYYQNLSVTECWQHGPEREVWRYIKEALADLPNTSILDIGCFRGEMLSYFGDGFELFGVEPSPDAAQEAKVRGVTIIAENIDALQSEQRRFGAITLVDVAEHLPKPLESFRILSRLLLPGGKLIVFTGNTDAPSWRFAGPDYYYSAMPEHLAFFGASWFQWAGPGIDCTVHSIKRLSYQPSPLGHRMDESLKNIAYLSYRRIERLPILAKLLSRVPLVARIGRWQGCWWPSARDHMLVILNKLAPV